ncbi:MAG: asparagine synthase (glutamine-hydrolyzing) [Deltaproteobacteria bacterium]|nr:asparagine synthase (glutamine-hydrolyzing) [Deltaproteobacteria bacterium]
MCGFAGILDLGGGPSDERARVVRAMTDTLVHRGPDDAGYFADAHVALGHRRLSIIDVATGQQPLANEDGTVWVVLNGEIYNYRDLRARLVAKGHTFTTRSDTETIVHAYEEWGAECVAQLRGMFAFALWDQRRRQLVLARDRVGKKPLYYASLGERLVFASELKALLRVPGLPRALDLEAVSDFVTLLYVPREKTIFRRVRKLLPGHTLVAGAAGVQLRRYWDVHFAPEPIGGAQAAARVAELLDEAVAIRLESDVPLGAFLSGGLDSSAVVGLMARHLAAPVATASIGFTDAAFDERAHAQLAARHFRTDHRDAVVTPSAAQTIAALSWFYDEPFGDSSAVPTYHVAQLARQRVTVALSGDGSDETFAGYRRYYFDGRENRVRDVVPAALRRPLFGLLGALYPKADYLPRLFRGKAFLGNLARTPWEAYLHSVSGVSEDDKQRLLAADTRRALGGYRTAELFRALYDAADGADALSRIQYIDFKTYLPDDILTKVDRASMANSLEVRCPFLDHHLIEYAARLPPTLKLRGRQSKLVLRQAVAGLVPDAILARPKMGFAMPVGQWLRTDLRELLHAHVLDDRAAHGLFDVETIRAFWREHDAGWRDRTAALWGLLVFNLWYDRFMREAP